MLDFPRVKNKFHFSSRFAFALRSDSLKVKKVFAEFEPAHWI